MLVSFSNVSKLYGAHGSGLDDVSFSVEGGEFVFLVGKSGAGKTTLLRLLIRDILPSKGEILLDGIDVTKIPKKKVPQLRQKIGVVFQDFKLLTERTIYENVAITLEIMGKSKDEIDKKVEEVLYLVGLSQKLHFFPSQLSAGELQRAAIARAIIAGPKLLLADEPTGNLDPITSWEILKILKEINKRGTTILMATHNADIVNSMKKRVIVLQKGKIIKDSKKGKYQ